MSTLRVDTLQTTDGSFSINVSDIGSGGSIDDVLTRFAQQDGNSLVGTVPDFTALRALVPSSEGLVVKLQQRLSTKPNIGGGYFISVLSSGTDDGGIIAAGTGYYWKRIDFKAVTPQMYGAPQTSGQNDGPQLRAALLYAQTNGIPMYIPAGEYYMTTGTLTINTGRTVIYGDGQGKSNINVSSTLTGFTVSPGVNTTTIRDLSLFSVGTTRTARTRGIYANGGNLSTGSIGYLDIHNVEVVGFADAVNLQYCQLGHIKGCQFVSNSNGYYSKLSVNQRISDTKVILSYGNAVFLDGDSSSVSFSAGTLINNCEFVNSGVNAASTILIQYNEHFTINNCMIDVGASTAQNGIHVIGTSRGTISSCWIGAHPQSGVRLENCLSIMVEGNNILAHVLYGVALLGSTTNCIVSGNCLEANGGFDLLSGGTASLNSFTGNICRSTTASYSFNETASGMNNVVTSNLFNQPSNYDITNTVFANNKQF